MIKEKDIVRLLRDLPDHNLKKGNLGETVRCHYALAVFDVQFIVDQTEKVIEIAVSGEDLELFSEGDHTQADQKAKATSQFMMNRFEEIFQNINKYKIKDGVDEMGLDRFVEHCARLAAATGAATGAWGPASLLGMPIDLVNTVVQQFRVTLAVIYDRTGQYLPSFESFMKIVAVSLGVEVGATLGKYALLQIAKQIVTRLAAGGAGRLIPFVGAAVVGGVNYAFIKSVGAALKEIDVQQFA